MPKRGLVLSLAFILVVAYAFAEESFTITTYYPSPYGSYNELEVHRGVTYEPLTSVPSTDLREGELVYVDNNPSDSTPGQFYYYGGGTWVEQGGGGGGCYTNYGGLTCATGYTQVLAGYTTIYLASRGTSFAGTLACSSISHRVLEVGSSFAGISADQYIGTVTNERCAICCK